MHYGKILEYATCIIEPETFSGTPEFRHVSIFWQYYNMF